MINSDVGALVRTFLLDKCPEVPGERFAVQSSPDFKPEDLPAASIGVTTIGALENHEATIDLAVLHASDWEAAQLLRKMVKAIGRGFRGKPDPADARELTLHVFLEGPGLPVFDLKSHRTMKTVTLSAMVVSDGY
jgi:hypothetical protein